MGQSLTGGTYHQLAAAQRLESLYQVPDDDRSYSGGEQLATVEILISAIDLAPVAPAAGTVIGHRGAEGKVEICFRYPELLVLLEPESIAR